MTASAGTACAGNFSQIPCRSALSALAGTRSLGRGTVVQLNTVVNSGSSGRIAEEIGKCALAHGWRSAIAFGRNPRPSASELIRVGSDFGVRLHAVRSRIFDDTGFGSRRATLALLRQLDALAPDIVHLHNLHGYWVHIGELFRWIAARGVPVVWTLHDCWAFTGHCAYFSAVGCEKWRSGCFACPQTRGYLTSLLCDRSRKNWEEKRALFSSVKNLTLVPVSDWLAKIAQRSFLGGKAEIRRIYNGVDTETFSPKNAAGAAAVRRKYGLADGVFTVLGCATAWGARKGLPDFFRLRERVPERELQIVLVGLKEAQLRALPRGIVGIRRTESTTELAELYSAADAVLNPTYEDTFSIINIEALACGTPVAMYRTGGAPEAIDANTGIVVPQGDLDALIAAIGTIRERGKAAYSAACRSRALAHFRAADRWNDYLALYEDRRLRKTEG